MKWYYRKDNIQEGPVDEEQVIDLLKHEIINGNTPVWKVGFEKWSTVNATELVIHLPKGSPKPPPYIPATSSYPSILNSSESTSQLNCSSKKKGGCAESITKVAAHGCGCLIFIIVMSLFVAIFL